MSDNPNPKIHAYLAKIGIASRRKAEEMVAANRVTINGATAKIGERVKPTDVIAIDGHAVNSTAEKFVYYLINKPIGYVSTTSDELGRKNVLSLIPKHSERLYPVGRLDMGSQGLMLLTNDGDLAYKLTHPKFEVPKTYHVKLDREISPKAYDSLKRGVRLKDGFAVPTELEQLDADQPGCWLSITVTEGRNRLVRRMCERVGYEVERLIRVKMGEYTLDQLEGKTYLQVFPQ
ncbi:MAG: pseudouridine synthase [Candidatus Pacebacteria bacterium CG10_big_fil_rev_8_21_14_0_10_44_11]|nr:MAG: pseudouridine synthase [Candidatus Pacebacteria bacterium CG10_big_fil_rev_8_21_14_0_10_44_11]